VTETGEGPFRRALADAAEAAPVGETQFERPRGVDRVEVKSGYVSVHVDLADPEERLPVLRAVAGQGVSIDFLKFEPNGLSFVVESGLRDRTVAGLETIGCRFEVRDGRCVVLVHAANMRDEEGLIPRIVGEFIAAGVPLDHLGDMHDRLLVVTSEEAARRASTGLAARLQGART
jgi:hypothetical protein